MRIVSTAWWWIFYLDQVTHLEPKCSTALERCRLVGNAPMNVQLSAVQRRQSVWLCHGADGCIAHRHAASYTLGDASNDSSGDRVVNLGMQDAF